MNNLASFSGKLKVKGFARIESAEVSDEKSSPPKRFCIWSRELSRFMGLKNTLLRVLP